MSESFVQLPVDGTGKLTRTSLQNINGNDVHSQIVTIGDPNTSNVVLVGASGIEVDVTRIRNPLDVNVITGTISVTSYQGGAWSTTNGPSVQTIGVVSASQSGIWNVNVSNQNPTYGSICAIQTNSYNTNGNITAFPIGTTNVNGSITSIQGNPIYGSITSTQSGPWNVSVNNTSVTTNQLNPNLLQATVTAIQTNSFNINGSVTATVGGLGTQNVNGSICAIQTNSYNVNGSVTTNLGANTITLGVVSASQSGIWNVNVSNTNPIYGNITAFPGASYNINGSITSFPFGNQVINGSVTSIQSGSYNVNGSINASQSGAWNVNVNNTSITANQSNPNLLQATVTANQINSFNINGSITSAQSAPIYGSITAAQLGSYNINGSVTSVQNNPIYGSITAAQSGIYSVTGNVGLSSGINQIGVVNATQSGSWNNVGVQGSITSVVVGSITAAQSNPNNLLATVTAIQTNSYNINGSVTAGSSTSSPSYVVVVSTDSNPTLVGDYTNSAIRVNVVAGGAGGGVVTQSNPNLLLSTVTAIQINSYNINGSITATQGSSVQTLGVVSASQSGTWNVNLNNPIYGSITSTQLGSYNINGSITSTQINPYLINGTITSVQSGTIGLSSGITHIGTVATSKSGVWDNVGIQGSITSVQLGSYNINGSITAVQSASANLQVATFQSSAPWTISGQVNNAISSNFQVAAAQGISASLGAAWPIRITDGTRTVEISANNGLDVGGEISFNAVDNGNPIKIGGRVVSTTAALTAANDSSRVNAMFDDVGKQVVVMNSPRDLVIQSTTSISNSSESIALSAGGAGIFHDLTLLTMTNKSACGMQVSLRDSRGGTPTMIFYLSSSGGAVVPFASPWKQTTANNQWTIQLENSISCLFVNIQAIKTI